MDFRPFIWEMSGEGPGVRALAALIAVLLVPSLASAHCPTGSATAAFLEPGRYGIGVRTLPLVDTSRPAPAHGTIAALPSRTLTTEIWYPTAPHTGALLRDGAAARGRFPLVLSSHGYSDTRTGEAYVAEALASRGYVVAAPDFPLTNLLTPPPRDPVDGSSFVFSRRPRFAYTVSGAKGKLCPRGTIEAGKRP